MRNSSKRRPSRFKNRVLLKRNRTQNVYKEKKYCMFFCRFGRCHNKNCKYEHDKDKIAVCTRFLRGTCRLSDCPFSHEVIPEKMPVCSFFLRGRCNNDSCQYIHVNVNPEASVCQDFAKGFCANGEKCKLRHVFLRKNDTNIESVSECTSKSKSRKTRNEMKSVFSESRSAVDKIVKKSESSSVFGFIPLCDHGTDKCDVNIFEKNDDISPNKIWSTLDYDSDDTWNNEEEVNDDQVKKPLIRIFPRLLLDS